MPRAKKKTYEPKAFESRNRGRTFVNQRGKNQADTSANIYESMLQSEAFKSLKKGQKVLYLYCKAQYYGKRKPSKDYKEQYQDDSCFYMNWGKALDYGLYPESSSKNFYSDMKALEEKGFIKKLKSGKDHKEKNVYQFVDDWAKEE